MPDLFSTIQRPTLLLDASRARRNLRRMAAKCTASGVRFRPHFKTHQSAVVGEWFREVGVEAITVSSIDMARYFAQNGWRDVTVAFPANTRQMAALNELAGAVQLNLLVESIEAVTALDHGLRSGVRAWVKVDTGYGRTGILWSDSGSLQSVASAIDRARMLTLAGLLTHAGHTYHAKSTAQIADIYGETVAHLGAAKEALTGIGRQLELSVGDTPSCSVVPRFNSVDEVRPGNFLFYDVQQWSLGACSQDDIAVALACPVVAKHPERGQLVIHGGAVHLSKESITLPDGRAIYGLIALPAGDEWTTAFQDSALVSLSQEHGIVQAEASLLDRVEVGDLLVVLPNHSCLTANLMGNYLTLGGQRIEMGRFQGS